MQTLSDSNVYRQRTEISIFVNREKILLLLPPLLLLPMHTPQVSLCKQLQKYTTLFKGELGFRTYVLKKREREVTNYEGNIP